MKNKKNNVIQFSKTVKVNAALIIFAVIVIYMIASIFRALNRHPVTTYKVSASDVNNNINCTGIALRTEKEVAANKTGYICYFLRDSDKVAKGGAVCTIDESGSVVSSISDTSSSDTPVFSTADYLSVRSTIDTFKSNYTDEKFFSVYNFDSTIQSKVLELSNAIMMKNYNAQTDTIKNSVSNMTADESGIVSFYTDGYEKYTPDTLPDDAFQVSSYKKTSLKSGDIVNSGTTVYKLITDEKWYIVCNISPEQANSILEKSNTSTSQSRLTFTINNSDYDITSNYELINKGNGFNLVLPVNKYLIDYVDERYLNISIKLNKYDGLKVPNTAIVTKEVYKLPKDLITRGGDESSENKIQVYRTDENGEAKSTQIVLEYYNADDKYYYVDKKLFKEGDNIIKMNSTDTIAANSLESTNIKGVYLANKGFADFKSVSIVTEGDEFTMINRGENINEYDNIVMDASEVKENQKLF